MVIGIPIRLIYVWFISYTVKHNQKELLTGLEPVTSSLPRKCSTTELQQHQPLFAFDQELPKLEFRQQLIKTQYCMVRAGEGNRTLVFSLEGCGSTIELHPQR